MLQLAGLRESDMDWGSRVSLSWSWSEDLLESSFILSRVSLCLYAFLFIVGNREQAFVYALSSACLVHAVAKACSSGLSSKCHCVPASGRAPAGSDNDLLPPPAGYQWGGCADDVEFASGFGEQFTDEIWRRRRVSRRTAANLHNTIAGRRVITRDH